ncbi:MAG: arylsulfotransferase family protein [Candidatus Dormibacteria bacterium]
MRYGFRRLRAFALRAGVGLLVVTSGLAANSAPAHADLPDDQVIIDVSGSSVGGMTTYPSLAAAFDPHTRDYAMYCPAGGTSVSFTLTAASGNITVDSQSGSTVSFAVTLAENQAVVLVAPDPDQPSTNTVNYWVRCLPHDFPQIQMSAGPGVAPAGYYFTGTFSGSKSGPPSSTYAMILDQNGTPVWYRNTPGGAIDVVPLGSAPYNRVAWAPSLGPGVGANIQGAFNVVQLDNDATSTIAAPVQPTDQHELLQLTNGHLMLISTPLRSGMDLSGLGSTYTNVHTVVDCLINEVDASGVAVGQAWRASDHVSVNESTSPALININGTQAADVYHCNSIDVDPSPPDPTVSGDVLVSARNTSAVYDVMQRNALGTLGPIKWKLGGNAVPATGTDNEPLITTSVADRFYNQHDVRFRPGGNISLYDDESSHPSGAARGIEYSLNLITHVATSVFQYAGPAGSIAPFTGSFRRSTDGTDNIVGWGGRVGSGFTEVDQNGQVMLEQRFPNGEFSYRAVKVPLSALNIDVLRRDAGLPRPAPAPPAPPAPLASPAPGTNLYGVLLNGSSQRVEVHGLYQPANYGAFVLHAATAFAPSSASDWQFFVAPYNGDGQPDLIGVHLRNTNSGLVEVHVLSAASGYNDFILHTATPLVALPPNAPFEFTVGSLDGDHRSNLYAIALDGTSSGMVEVHALSDASGYTAWVVHSATALSAPLRTGSWQFRVGDAGGQGDLVGISHTATGSGHTEVHALARSSSYSVFSLHTATPLGYTQDSQFSYTLGDHDADGTPDLYAVAMNGTSSGRTEVHVLSGVSGFARWQEHAASALGPTDNSLWQFSAAN